MGRRLVVEAATAERVEHDPGPRHQAPPERTIEQDRDAEVVAGPVVMRDMFRHRAAEPLPCPFDLLQPVVRQRDDDRIERLRHDTSGAAGGHDIAVVASARHTNDRRVELDAGAGQAPLRDAAAAFPCRLRSCTGRHSRAPPSGSSEARSARWSDAARWPCRYGPTP